MIGRKYAFTKFVAMISIGRPSRGTNATITPLTPNNGTKRTFIKMANDV